MSPEPAARLHAMNIPALFMTLTDEQLGALAREIARVLRDDHAKANTSPYLTVHEAAQYLRCRPQRVYDLLSARALTRHKDGSRVLVRRAEIDRYLA
jgi:excisionase family DNA binding protein